MKTPLWDVDPRPTLLFDPDSTRGAKLAAALRREGFIVDIAASAAEMLTARLNRSYDMLIVVADMDDADCLIFLSQLRRAAPRSWLVLINARADEAAHMLARRIGADALIAASVSLPDLVRRLASLLLCERPVL